MLAAAENLAVGVADAQALKVGAASGDKEALRSAAKQFESLMVAQMLRTMRQTRFSDEDDPLTGGDSLKLYRELLDQQWAARLAKGRGLGFADMLVKAFERQSAAVSSQSSVAGAESSAAGGESPARGSEAALPSPPAGTMSMTQEAAGKSKPATDNWPLTAGGERKQRFLESLRPHAEAAEAATGVPARFILAQAALESGWGEKEIRAADGQASFNLFGIKAGRNWGGESVETATTEYRQGLAMKLTQRFRAYPDYTAAFTDYANLLRSRFGEAVRAGDDAAAFAKGLADGGYATDPAYAGKLRAVIASVAMAGV